jgi:hypothetical protein
MSCGEMMSLAKDLQIQHIVVVTDCLAIVNNMESPLVSIYSMLLHEVEVMAKDKERVEESKGFRFSHPLLELCPASSSLRGATDHDPALMGGFPDW